MSWFSSFLHDVGTPSSWFSSDPPPVDPSIAASQATAVKAQQDALALATQAAQPQQDSESARAAADDERRRLTAGSSFSIGLPTKMGAPPVGFRLLSGS